MIHSMTGYGKSVLQLPTKKITIELKSLNSKNLDLNARMPSIYREKELGIRKLLAEKLVRGKVDFSIFVETTAEDTSTQINTPVVKQYISQLKNVVEGSSEIELLKMAVRFPDALNTVREEIDENEWKAIADEINKAVDFINNYRLNEGKVLEVDFNKRVAAISEILEQVIAIDPERIEAVRERLNKGVADLKEKYDENRFEQELVYYIEKFDITEEKVRLKNHLNYFIETLNSKDSNGKKLGFIGQEMGREINTIGSKSNYAPMQQLVVQMKDELEKIKEQLLNVL
ncbi:YicC/YloC family endoribonuclease [Postechiella marina]